VRRAQQIEALLARGQWNRPFNYSARALRSVDDFEAD